MSVDPIPTDPSSGNNFSSYWYANNNPLSLVDPDGRSSESTFCGVTGCNEGTSKASGETKVDLGTSVSNDKTAPKTNNPAKLPTQEAYALSQVLGETVETIEGITVLENSNLAALLDASAVTTPYFIHLSGSMSEFLSSPDTVLEEYYHVTKQWDVGKMKLTDYGAASVLAWWSGEDPYDGNIFEIEAKTFAESPGNLKAFEYYRSTGSP